MFCATHAADREDCARCGNPLAGKFLTAVGKKWHNECFRCSKCNKNLQGVGFVLRNNLPVCGDCKDKK